jgi:hypothetical protein
MLFYEAFEKMRDALEMNDEQIVELLEGYAIPPNLEKMIVEEINDIATELYIEIN